MNGQKQDLLVFEQRGRIWVGTIRTNSVLSAGNVVEFGNEVLAFIQQHPAVNLILNFENVDYLSSAVLTELLRINKAIQDTNGRLRLCAISPVIREVFEITNLDKIFVIHSDGLDLDIQRFQRAIDVEAQEAAWQEPGT